MADYKKEISIILSLSELDLIDVAKRQAKNLNYKGIVFDKMQVKRMFDDSAQIPAESKAIFYETFRETFEAFKIQRLKYFQHKIECLKRKMIKETAMLNKLNSIGL